MLSGGPGGSRRRRICAQRPGTETSKRSRCWPSLNVLVLRRLFRSRPETSDPPWRNAGPDTADVPRDRPHADLPPLRRPSRHVGTVTRHEPAWPPSRGPSPWCPTAHPPDTQSQLTDRPGPGVRHSARFRRDRADASVATRIRFGARRPPPTETERGRLASMGAPETSFGCSSQARRTASSRFVPTAAESAGGARAASGRTASHNIA